MDTKQEDVDLKIFRINIDLHLLRWITSSWSPPEPVIMTVAGLHLGRGSPSSLRVKGVACMESLARSKCRIQIGVSGTGMYWEYREGLF